MTSRENRTGERLSSAFQAAVFERHRFGLQPRAAQLPNVSDEQLGDWLAGLRQPDNAALVVVSAANPRQTLDQAAAAFASQAARAALQRPPALHRPERPGAARVSIVETDDARGHPRLSIGCRLPSTTLREAARAHLLARLLEADFWNEVREPHGHSYGFGVEEHEHRDATVVALVAEIPAAVLTELLAKLRQRWRQWAQQGFDAGQVAVVRSGAAASTALDGRTSAALARQLARWWALGRTLEDRERWAATLGALEPNELQATAALCRANLVLALAADRGLAEAAVKAGWKD